MGTLQSSFDLARQTSARPWEAEKARLRAAQFQPDDRYSQETGLGCRVRPQPVCSLWDVFPARYSSACPSIVSARSRSWLFSQRGWHRLSRVLEWTGAVRCLLCFQRLTCRRGSAGPCWKTSLPFKQSRAPSTESPAWRASADGFLPHRSWRASPGNCMKNRTIRPSSEQPFRAV